MITAIDSNRLLQQQIYHDSHNQHPCNMSACKCSVIHTGLFKARLFHTHPSHPLLPFIITLPGFYFFTSSQVHNLHSILQHSRCSRNSQHSQHSRYSRNSRNSRHSLISPPNPLYFKIKALLLHTFWKRSVSH